MELKYIACKVKKQNGGWYEVAKIGHWKGHNAGEFELSTTDLNQMLFNFKNQGLDIVVDYEHQTLTGEKAPASGWIKHPEGLKIENDTLLAKIEWTPKAKEAIKNKEYRYLSPVLIQNAKDSKSGTSIGWYLHSVALTNTPFFKELEPIAAKQKQTEGDNMEKADLEKLQEQNKKLQKQLDAISKENKELKEYAAKQKVKDAIEAKKIAKEQEEWATQYALKDPQGFNEFIDNAKPITQIPESNQFAASSKPEGTLDIVKLALGENNG